MAQELSLKFGAVLGGSAKSTFTSLRNGIRDVAKELKKLAQEQLKLGKTDVSASLDKMSKRLMVAGRETKKTTKEFKKATTEAKKLGTVVSQLGRSFQTYGRYMIASGTLRGITASWNAGTGAIKEHDQALHDLKAIMNATDTEVKLMNASILEVASSTKFSIGETAQGMKLLGQAGFTASEAISAIGPVANLATGTLSTLDSTVQLVSTAVRVFQLDAADTARVTDIFANAVNRSKLTIDKLNTAFNYIGPIANAAGMNLEEVAASMMLLANSGLRASTIGTGMRRMLTLLLKPTKEFKEAVYAAGYTMDDMNPKMNKFSTIVGNLSGVVGDAEDAVKMFGIRGASVISSFVSQGQSEFDRLAQVILRSGAASKMATEQMKGLGIAIKNMKDKFGVLAQALGEGGFTAAWKALVNAIRGAEDIMIAFVRTGLGQLIVKLAGAVTAIAAVSAALIILRRALTSTIVVNFTAQVIELTARMLAFNLSMKGLSGATMTSALANMSSAFATFGTRIKATIASLGLFIKTNPLVATVLIALTAVMAAVTAGWIRNTSAMKDAIVENEIIAGSLEVVKSSIERYNKVMERGGASEKAFLVVKKQVLSTFDKFGSAIKGYSEKQEELNKKLKASNLTESETLAIYAEKGKLLKDYIVGNVKKLTESEIALKVAAEQAAATLRDENASLEEQQAAVAVLAGIIDTQLLAAYDKQATAALTLWAQNQTLIDSWERFKKIVSAPIVYPYKTLVAGLDFIRQRLLGMPSIAEEAKYSFLGISHSFEELKEKAEEGLPKAVEALGLLEQLAQKTVEGLLKNKDIVTMTNDEVQVLVDSLKETDEIKLQAIEEEIQKVKETTIEANKTFKEAFGKNLTVAGQEALKDILYILNESKDVSGDLAKKFLELGETDFTELVGYFEGLEASLKSGKVDSETLKDSFAQLFDKLPASKWEQFQSRIRNGLSSIGEDSKVIAIATEALVTASFTKLGIEMDKVPAKFQGLVTAFNILTLSGKASVGQIVGAFTKLGESVDSVGSFDVLLTTFRELQRNGVITGQAMEQSFGVVEAAFKKAFAEPLKEVADARKAVQESAKELTAVYGTALDGIRDKFTKTFGELVTEFEKVETAIKNSDLSVEEKARKMTQAYKDFSTESVTAISEFKTKSLEYITHLSNSIKENAKANGVDVSEIEKQILVDKKEIYTKTVEAHKALMDKLVAHEQSRKEKVKSIEQDIANTRKNYAETTRDIQRGAMDSLDAYKDTQAELNEVTRKLGQAAYKSEEWNGYLERAKELAGNLNSEVKKTVQGYGDVAGGEIELVSKAEATNNTLAARAKINRIVTQAQEKALKVAEKEVVAAGKLKEAESERLKSAQEQVESLGESINQSLVDATDKFGTEVDKLKTTLQDNALVIDAENLLSDVKSEIDKFTTDFEKNNKLQMTVEPKVEEFQNKIKEITNSESYPELELLVSDKKAQEVMKNLQSEFDNFAEGMSNQAVEIKLTGDSTAIDEIKKKVEELEATEEIHLIVKAEGKREVDDLAESVDDVEDKEVDVEAVVAAGSVRAVEKLYDAIRKLKDKTITITTRYKTVGKPPVTTKAEGGYIELAGGGDPYSQFRKLQSPEINKGSGYKDDVPAMLMKGEFVLKKSAVAKYGKKFLYQLNSGFVPRMPGFADGGIASKTGDAISSTIRKAQLGWNPSSPFKEGGTVFNVNSPSFYGAMESKASALSSPQGRNGVSALLNSFASVVPNLKGGGDVGALLPFNTEKQNLINIYKDDIARAKNNGRDDVAFAFDVEKLQIEELASSLLATLEQVRMDYKVEKAKLRNSLSDYKNRIAEEQGEVDFDYADSLSNINRERFLTEKRFKLEQGIISQKKQSAISNSVFGTPFDGDVGLSWEDAIHRYDRELHLLRSAYLLDKDLFQTREDRGLLYKKIYTDNIEKRIGDRRSSLDIERETLDARENITVDKKEHQFNVDVREKQRQTDDTVSQIRRETEPNIKHLKDELKQQIEYLRNEYENIAGSSTLSSDPNIAAEQIGAKHWLNKGGSVGYPAQKARGQDSVPAMLTPGEHVINEGAVQNYGTDFMDALNRQEISPSYAAFPGAVPFSYDNMLHHVNAPSFHNKVKKRTNKLLTPIGLESAGKLTSIFKNAVPHLASGGDLGDSEQQMNTEIGLVTAEYEEQIAFARTSGNEELAYILEREQMELELLAEEYAMVLQEILYERDSEIADANWEYSDKVWSLRNSYASRAAQINAQITSLNNARYYSGSSSSSGSSSAPYTRSNPAPSGGFSSSSTRSLTPTQTNPNTGMPIAPSGGWNDPTGSRWNSRFAEGGEVKGYASGGMITATGSGYFAATPSYWGGSGPSLPQDDDGSSGPSSSSVPSSSQSNSSGLAAGGGYYVAGAGNTAAGMIAPLKAELAQLTAEHNRNMSQAVATRDRNIKGANIRYGFDKLKSDYEYLFDVRKTEMDADHDYFTREQDMIHDIKMYEIELAQRVFKIKKDYSTADGDFGVRHWLNKGGQVGSFPESIRGKDSVPSMLTPGEFVMKESVVQKFGKSFFDKLNNFQMPDLSSSVNVQRFADGGIVQTSAQKAQAQQNTLQNTAQSDTFLGTVNLQVGKTTYPVKADVNLARQLISEFKRMGLSIA